MELVDTSAGAEGAAESVTVAAIPVGTRIRLEAFDDLFV